MLYASVLLFTFSFAGLAHVFIELPLAKIWVITLKKIQKASVVQNDGKSEASNEVLKEDNRTSQTSL